MDMESIEKYTSVSVLTVFATIRGWIGWLIVLYCVAMCTDWLTGTILAIKNAEWNSSKAREGLWHKCGSIFCLAVALLTDLLLSLPFASFLMNLNWISVPAGTLTGRNHSG